jgi:uncharacterized LabA/DUF88 family protein
MNTAIFIDGANLHASAKLLGFNIDFKKLLRVFGGEHARALYYTAVNDSTEEIPLQKLLDWLSYNGFIVRWKPMQEYTRPDGSKKIKGNMDMEIAVDMLDLADKVQRIVLFSGDGDFAALIEAAQRKGAFVTVVSTMKSQPPMIHNDLRRQADQYLDLIEVRPQIEQVKQQTVGEAAA